MRDFYRQVVIDQVRACLLCDLHPLEVGDTYKKTPDELLVQISDGVFNYLGSGRQRGLRRLVYENVFKRIHSHWGSQQLGVKLEGGQLIVRWNAPDEKEAFLNWLEDRRISFDTSRPTPIEQGNLFDCPDNSDRNGG
jgi:hypothetical protein